MLSILGCVWLLENVFRKIIFSGNANFRTRKMFPCVWLHFKKFSGKYFKVFGVWKRRKTQIRKHKPQPIKKKIINDDRAVIAIRDRDRDPTSRSRLLREIAPRTGARARTGARDLRLELELVTWTGSSPLARARALSLSLSLIFRKCFEGKIEV